MIRRCNSLAAVLMIVPALVGCSPNASTADEAVPVPSNIASEAEVGGTVIPLDGLISTASSCGIDTSSQWAGSTPHNTAAFERKTPEGIETVILGSWPWPEADATAGLAALTTAIQSPSCNVRNRSSVLLTGFDAPTVAFHAIERPDHGPAASEADARAEARHRSTKRAYTWVNGTMVMVWLTRIDAGDPSTRDLHSLLEAQLRAVQDDAE